MFHVKQFKFDYGKKKVDSENEAMSEILKLREKKKWQLALRRYVVEKNNSPIYAYNFGLSIDQFRDWIEIQFTDGLGWTNFGTAWHFEHIVPVGYFDFSNDDHLKLCWNFVNIRVQNLEPENESGYNVPVIAAKVYFETLYNNTGYILCVKILEHIIQIERKTNKNETPTEAFIKSNKLQLDIITTLSKEEFNNINLGISVEDIFLEREILQKFG